ncbi:hypothetical protein MicloDRAFT_00032400 [Microvirga lotononidis]|uniref:Uncharacterized protein n=1 Tax=Microvirga lotononidis TaxID=864069 RepID=I4YRU8_9HYPH|nr:hypothetical protein MicloDRAFT_00032400 [Microvirga lotononidis]
MRTHLLPLCCLEALAGSSYWSLSSQPQRASSQPKSPAISHYALWLSLTTTGQSSSTHTPAAHTLPPCRHRSGRDIASRPVLRVPETTGSHYITLDETTGSHYRCEHAEVIQTPTFLADAKAAALDDAELTEITATIAANPLIGDIIPGTGGARKVRFGGKGSQAGIGSSPTTLPRTCPCSFWRWSTKANGPTSAKPIGTPCVKSLAPSRTNTARVFVTGSGRPEADHF